VICVSEVGSALCRRRRESKLSPRDYAKAKQALFEDIEDASVVNLTDQVVAVPGSVPFAKTAVRPFGRRKVAPEPRAGAEMDGADAMPTPATVLGNMEFPLLGRIAAGQPVEAIPNAETFSFGDFTAGRGSLFVLRVKGDSMIDDHICNGDYILVEGTQTAENGEIVVALVEGTDATLKRFFRAPNGKVRLQPANAQMDPIIVPAREVKIQGKVVGVLRKY